MCCFASAGIVGSTGPVGEGLLARGDSLGAILGVDTHVVPVERRLVSTGRPMKSVRVVFEAQVVGGELTHEVDGTTDEARWIPLDGVAGLSRVSLVDIAIRLWRDSRTRV